MPQHKHIRILPVEIANLIVAGEAVERPASIVKELIENSLDAGARAISIEIQDGGLDLIRVSDDGHGIARDDISLVLERFATSKIRSAQDLQAIHTLGFRGEALSSIAAVARLEILTRTADELEGSRLLTKNDDKLISAASSPMGTSVTVRQLFQNTPARRKLLKSPIRESELVRKIVTRYALAWPKVAFRLIANGKENLVAVGPTTPWKRLVAVLGPDIAAEMYEIDWQAGELRVTGYISDPAVGKSNRQGQHFILNGRPIRSGLLAVMLERPYAGRLPPGRHPLAAIHIEIDPSQVDVNIHPQKTEVRFTQEHILYQALLWAVEAGLAPFPRQEEYPSLDWPFGNVPTVSGVSARESEPEYVVAGGLRVLSQLRNTFIIAQGSEGLAVIDQHAAHEQVLFENLLHGDQAVNLEPPVQLELAPRETERLYNNLNLLADLGLKIEPSGKKSFTLRSIPSILIHSSPLKLITALLTELERDWHLDEERLRERVIARAACVAAIQAGEHLSLETMQDLVDDLLMVWSPATCPHGRSAFITLGIKELQDRFLRR